jgi:hypothetical protein
VVALAGATWPVLARGTDVLGTPVTLDESARLWPFEVSLEIVGPGVVQRPGPRRGVNVPDGKETTMDHVVWTPTGERRFQLAVTPRHHVGGMVELEWELRVSEAAYVFEGGLDAWRAYVVHRLALGPKPPLGPTLVRAVEADIVAVRGGVLEHSIRVGQDIYDVRLSARSTRG